MSDLITVQGVVLSAMPVGDYDKRIVLLTRERGKIAVFAKGARRQNSHLLGATNPFSFGEFVLYEGRSSYNLLQANISNYFMELATDLEGAYYGFYFMEFADYYTKEHNDERQMLRLLYQTLRALSSNKIPRELVRYIFELKTLVVNGEYPDVFHCTGCGTREQGVLFSCRNRGIVCEKCRRTVSDGIQINSSTLYTMQYVVTSTIEKLYTFVVSDEVLKQLGKIMKQYTGMYVDKRFKSLEILEMCLLS